MSSTRTRTYSFSLTGRDRDLIALAMVVLFTATRWVGVSLLFTQSASTALPPVNYYDDGLTHPTTSHALWEYPVPLYWVTKIYGHFAHITGLSHLSAAVGLVLILDAAIFLILMYHRRWWGAGYWIIAPVALGPLFWARWDIVPAALVAWGLAVLARHPRVASAVMGLAAATKIWPALLGGVLVGHYQSRATWQRVGWFLGAAIGTTLVAILDTSWERVSTSITYQDNRGLQVESVWATVAMLGHWLAPSHWSVFWSTQSLSMEVSGPTVGVAMASASALMTLMVIVTLAWCVAALFGKADKVLSLVSRRGSVPTRWAVAEWNPAFAAWAAIALILGVIVTNKVLSPQYMIWVLVPIAVCLDNRPGSPASLGRGAALLWRLFAVVGIVIALLTQVLYPWQYGEFLGGTMPSAVLAGALRNVLLVVWFGLVTASLVRYARAELARR